MVAGRTDVPAARSQFRNTQYTTHYSGRTLRVLRIDRPQSSACADRMPRFCLIHTTSLPDCAANATSRPQSSPGV